MVTTAVPRRIYGPRQPSCADVRSPATRRREQRVWAAGYRRYNLRTREITNA